MLTLIQQAVSIIYLQWLRNLKLVPEIPMRDTLRRNYNKDNPDAGDNHRATIHRSEQDFPYSFSQIMGRGTIGRTCRRDHKILIETLRKTLFDPDLLFQILTLKEETDIPCLFYLFISMRMYSLTTGLRPLFIRSDQDTVTYTHKRRLGMVGMMGFVAQKMLSLKGKSLHTEYNVLILSFFRKNLGKRESGLMLGHSVARMRNEHTLDEMIYGIMHNIPTFRFNFIPGMTIIVKYQNSLRLAKAFMMYASILSRIPVEFNMEVKRPAGSEGNTEPTGLTDLDGTIGPTDATGLTDLDGTIGPTDATGLTGPIFDSDFLTQTTFDFLKSLHRLMFNSRIEKNTIYEFFMREYSRIMLGFTVLSSEERVNSALSELFGVINLSPEDSKCFLDIVSFMKTHCLYSRFDSSDLNFFQWEVNRIVESSGEFESDVLFRKMRENDAFWNIMLFVIYSQNEWAKKHSQPCLPIKLIIEILLIS
jgi:hypothetical protein